jgi:hypothetical protein
MKPIKKATESTTKRRVRSTTFIAISSSVALPSAGGGLSAAVVITLTKLGHKGHKARQMDADAIKNIAFLFSPVLLALCFGVVGLAIKNRRQATKLNQLTSVTRDYIEAFEQSRVFAPVVVPGLHLEQGEFAIRHERATLAEVRRARIGSGLGTRVRVGGFPIYLGAWKSIPNEELREVGTGDLVLTNRRLLFLGGHTLALPFDKLLTCQQMHAALLVSESRSKRPHVFILDNAGLWCFLVNWAADSRFKDPKLPDGMHISVSGKAPELQIHVTGSATSKR